MRPDPPRCYDRITPRVLDRLSEIAAEDRADRFERKPRWEPYRQRVLCVALCQGAALHYVDGRNGVKDLDVWTFFAEEPRVGAFPPRWRLERRFDLEPFKGHFVDLIGRSLAEEVRADPVAVVRRYLSQGATRTARALTRNAVVLLDPEPLRGKVVWPPSREITATVAGSGGSERNNLDQPGEMNRRLNFSSLRMAGSEADRRDRLRAVLERATGIRTEDPRGHVRLDEHIGTRAIQRAALDERDAEVVLSVWPGELKPQAEHIYSHGRAERLASLDDRPDWTVRPTPHLAFFTAHPRQRLYMHCELPIGEYVGRWGGEDGEYIGQWQPEDVRAELWPWLVDRGYADPDDDIERFLSVLRTRDAHLRPGMVVERIWSVDEAEALDDRGEFAEAVRDALSLVLRLADEPSLPETSTAEGATAAR